MVKTRSSPVRGACTEMLQSGPIPLSRGYSSHEAITVVENCSPKNKPCQFDNYKICTPQNLCGPHPKKVTIVVALILSIWASFILGINVHKKVITMEDKLESMSKKMLDLQMKYLHLRVQSKDEIARLHHKINALNNDKGILC